MLQRIRRAKTCLKHTVGTHQRSGRPADSRIRAAIRENESFAREAFGSCTCPVVKSRKGISPTKWGHCGCATSRVWGVWGWVRHVVVMGLELVEQAGKCMDSPHKDRESKQDFGCVFSVNVRRACWRLTLSCCILQLVRCSQHMGNDSDQQSSVM